MIDGVEVPAGDAPAQPREIQWRRTPQGEMTVWVDGGEVMRVTDRGYVQRFTGVRILNEGGVYTLRRISVHAVPS